MTSRTATAAQVIIQLPLEVLRFDAFRLFPRRRLLLQNDALIHIGDRAFDLLLALASHAGEILSHNELIGTVWPKRVVADCNLKTQVGALQKILGLAPDGRRYIKSVALRGYVFVADVHMLPWYGSVLPEAREEAVATALTFPCDHHDNRRRGDHRLRDVHPTLDVCASHQKARAAGARCKSTDASPARTTSRVCAPQAARPTSHNA